MFAASLLVVAACDGADDQADAATAPDAAQGVDAGPPPLDDAPHKGPWVQQPTTTGATVRWETQIAPAVVGVEVTPESGGSSLPFDGVSRETTTQLSYGVDSPVVDEPDVPGTYFVNEVRVDGLEPARCYTYRLVGWPTEGGRFCTLHEPSDTETPIRFFVMGDTSPGIGGTLRLIELTRVAVSRVHRRSDGRRRQTIADSRDAGDTGVAHRTADIVERGGQRGFGLTHRHHHHVGGFDVDRLTAVHMTHGDTVFGDLLQPMLLDDSNPELV